MFKSIRTRRALREARRQYDLAVLKGAMAANQARLDEIRRRDEGPCQACVDAGFIVFALESAQ
jgi:hypothetical protein